MLALLLDLETMYGLPDGLVGEELLARRFGAAAVRTARANGLVRGYDRARCRAEAGPAAGSPAGAAAGPAVGLTARGRMVAMHGAHPFELAAEPHEIVSAVLYGGRL